MEVRDETAPYCWPTSFNDFYPIDARAGAAGRFTISASDRDDNAPTQRHRADERLSTWNEVAVKEAVSLNGPQQSADCELCHNTTVHGSGKLSCIFNVSGPRNMIGIS
jgi:hypothetical protein